MPATGEGGAMPNNGMDIVRQCIEMIEQETVGLFDGDVELQSEHIEAPVETSLDRILRETMSENMTTFQNKPPGGSNTLPAKTLLGEIANVPSGAEQGSSRDRAAYQVRRGAPMDAHAGIHAGAPSGLPVGGRFPEAGPANLFDSMELSAADDRPGDTTDLNTLKRKLSMLTIGIRLLHTQIEEKSLMLLNTSDLSEACSASQYQEHRLDPLLGTVTYEEMCLAFERSKKTYSHLIGDDSKLNEYWQSLPKVAIHEDAGLVQRALSSCTKIQDWTILRGVSSFSYMISVIGACLAVSVDTTTRTRLRAYGLGSGFLFLDVDVFFSSIDVACAFSLLINSIALHVSWFGRAPSCESIFGKVGGQKRCCCRRWKSRICKCCTRCLHFVLRGIVQWMPLKLLLVSNFIVQLFMSYTCWILWELIVLMAIICRAGPEAVNNMMDLIQELTSAPTSWIDNGGTSDVLSGTENYCHMKAGDFAALHDGAKNLFLASAFLMLASAPLLACVSGARRKFKMRHKMISLKEALGRLSDISVIEDDVRSEEKRKLEISDWRRRVDEQYEDVLEAEELLNDVENDLIEAREAHETKMAEDKRREDLEKEREAVERAKREKAQKKEFEKKRAIYFPGIHEAEKLRHDKELEERLDFYEQQLQVWQQHFGGTQSAQASADGLDAVPRKRGATSARSTASATMASPPGAIATSRRSPRSAPLARSPAARNPNSPRIGLETSAIGKPLKDRTRADAEKKSARQPQKHLKVQSAPVGVQRDVWLHEDIQRMLDDKPVGLSGEQLANQLNYRPEHEAELLQPRTRAKSRRSKGLNYQMAA